MGRKFHKPSLSTFCGKSPGGAAGWASLGWEGKKSPIQLSWGWAPGTSISSTALSASVGLTQPLLLGPVPSPALHQPTLGCARQGGGGTKADVSGGAVAGTRLAPAGWGGCPQP